MYKRKMGVLNEKRCKICCVTIKYTKQRNIIKNTYSILYLPEHHLS